MIVLESCGGKRESVTELKNGAFKIDIRTQEFHDSGSLNIDVCVADVSSREFPKKKIQCFLHGYDFSGFSVKWLSKQEIEISFDCGRVTAFSNYAVVSPDNSLPVQFHASLLDGCKYDYVGSVNSDAKRDID
jgi:hypothetical protein